MSRIDRISIRGFKSIRELVDFPLRNLVVEDPTEQLFVDRVLAPCLSLAGLHFHATQIPNRGGRGGDVHFERASASGIPEPLIQAALEEAGVPERIDRSPETAPSRRLAAWSKGQYGKTTTGIAAAQSSGIPAMRAACPNFDAWLSFIERAVN